jgi:hypothetical protein
MDMLDRVGQKGRDKNSPDRMGLFQPSRRKAEALLLAWMSASLKSSRCSERVDGVRFFANQIANQLPITAWHG